MIKNDQNSPSSTSDICRLLFLLFEDDLVCALLLTLDDLLVDFLADDAFELDFLVLVFLLAGFLLVDFFDFLLLPHFKYVKWKF